MFLGRLISLLLSVALVACPVVCRAGMCNHCPIEQLNTAACPHCQANQKCQANPETPTSDNEGDTDDRPSHCELGNCLCAGAVTNSGGLDLQIDHVLNVFAACETLTPQILCGNLSNHEPATDSDHDDPQSSGRRLRLRIESLLI